MKASGTLRETRRLKIRVGLISVPLSVILLFSAGCSTVTTPRINQLSKDAQTLRASLPGAESQAWIRSFNAPELIELVDEAWRRNPSLESSFARLEAARAQAVVTGAARYPAADLSLSASRSRTNLSGLELYNNSFGLSAGVAWELDLWGRIAQRHQASLKDRAAAERDYSAARLLLAGDIARAWLRTLEARLQVSIFERRRDSFKETLDVIDQRYRLGLKEALDVYLARENLATAEAALIGRRIAADANARVLTALLGRYPDPADLNSNSLPAISASIPANLDLTTLTQRPDLAAARLRLEAEELRTIDQAHNWLPSIAITGSGGTANEQFKNLLDLDNLVWRIAASISQPVFQAGRLKAQRELQRSQLRQTATTYAQVALTALRELETALAADPLYAEQIEHQKVAGTEARAAAELALKNYAAGLTDIETLLNAQRRAFSAESNLLATELNRLLNRIDLHLALGGDFVLTQTSEMP